jgi:hypothetical protein
MMGDDDDRMWSAQYRARSLTGFAARQAQRVANLGTRVSTRLADVLAPETTRWGANLIQRLGRTETDFHEPKYAIAGADDDDPEPSHALQTAWNALYETTPPLSAELVARLLERLDPAATKTDDKAGALCDVLARRLLGQRVSAVDATLLRLLRRELPSAKTAEGKRKHATILWDLVEQYDARARTEVLHRRDVANNAQGTVVRGRRSTWSTRRGDAGFLDEATQRLTAHFIEVFGTARPSLSCPDKKGPLKLTPPQEVVRYLFDPATGPQTMRFVVVQRPGLGKTLCMLAAYAAHWKAYKAELASSPGLAPPSFLLLAEPQVQDNLKKELLNFRDALGIGDMPTDAIQMIDFKYGSQATVMQPVRRIGKDPRGVTCVDEAHELVDLSPNKQRNAAGAASPRMKENATAVARILETELHPSHTLLLATGTALGSLEKLVKVVQGGSPTKVGTLIECMALRNTDVFPRLVPGIGGVPDTEAGEYRPFAAQNIVRVPFMANKAMTDEPDEPQFRGIKQTEAPDESETKKSVRAAMSYAEALALEKDAKPKKYLPQVKYDERKNCTASYLGFLVSAYSPEFQAAVVAYPFSMVPKLAACAAAILKMHFESRIFPAERTSNFQLIAADRGPDDLVMLTFEYDGMKHTAVRKIERGPVTSGDVVVLKLGTVHPPDNAANEHTNLRIEGLTEPFYVSNAPTDAARPRQLIMLDKKHGLGLFPRVIKAVAKKLYPTVAVPVDKLLLVLDDKRKKDEMDAAFHEKQSAPWLVANAAEFSESIDLPGPYNNPVAVQHYVSIPVDAKGRGNASQFVQGMLRTARFCKSRPGWNVRLLMYQLVDDKHGSVATCDENAMTGLREQTTADFKDSDAPFVRARRYAIDAAVMQHINDGTEGEVDPNFVAPRPWLGAIDLSWVEELVATCAVQDEDVQKTPCVARPTSDCPEPLCRVDAGRCVSRPEGTVCDRLSFELERFEAWANGLSDHAIAGFHAPAEDAVRTLMDAGAFAGADNNPETEGKVRKVFGNMLRAARLGRYQPYFDAASVNAASRAKIHTLVDAIAASVGDSVEARTLACAVLMAEWMKRPEFHFGERFVKKVLPTLTTAVGDRLFGLGIPRYGLSGEDWYEGWFWRFLAQSQTGAREYATQAGRHVGFAKDAVVDQANRLQNLARRMVGLAEVHAQRTAEWASSPHTLFALLLLERIMLK